MDDDTCGFGFGGERIRLRSSSQRGNHCWAHAMSKQRTMTPSVRISDIETAKAVIGHEAVPCYVARFDWKKRKKQPATLTSCFGGRFWGRQGESWPVSAQGTPLFPWLQVNCSDVKRAYGPFYGKRVIAFYLNQDFRDGDVSSKDDEADFVVRTYLPGERLTPLVRPKPLVGHRYVEIRWREENDYPSLSKYYDLFAEETYSALCDAEGFEYDNKGGTKIGGWTSLLQTDQEYPGSWDLQISITPNFMYLDSGIAYLKKTGDGWYARFDTC